MTNIMVGDVGGTHVRFAIASKFAGETRSYKLTEFRKFPNEEFGEFEEAIAAYIEGLVQRPSAAVFAVAGPVGEGEIKLTNRDWCFSCSGLQTSLALPKVQIINDFVAMARGVPETQSNALIEIKSGLARIGAPQLVAGPGTGFGAALLILGQNDAWRVISTEGGHQNFTAITPLEFELRRLLEAKYGFVSLEMVSAGKHLRKAYEMLCQIYGTEPVNYAHPRELLARAAQGDEVCNALCQLRANATMTALGDMVCASGALGGVTIAGGVAGRLLDYLKNEESVARFVQHGGHTDYVEPVPINYLDSDEAPLLGAACFSAI